MTDGALPDLVALVDRVHSDGLYLGFYAHQMLRLNVSIAETPRASELLRPEGSSRAEIEYSIDGHSDSFGLISRTARWNSPIEKVTEDLVELLADKVEILPGYQLGWPPGETVPVLDLPFEFTGDLAGDVQEIYQGKRRDSVLVRQWQLETRGSGVAAVESARDAALEAGWDLAAAAHRVDGRPRSISLRKGEDWIHVRQAYMESNVREDADAPQVLALIRWRN